MSVLVERSVPDEPEDKAVLHEPSPKVEISEELTKPFVPNPELPKHLQEAVMIAQQLGEKKKAEAEANEAAKNSEEKTKTCEEPEEVFSRLDENNKLSRSSSLTEQETEYALQRAEIRKELEEKRDHSIVDLDRVYQAKLRGDYDTTRDKRVDIAVERYNQAKKTTRPQTDKETKKAEEPTIYLEENDDEEVIFFEDVNEDVGERRRRQERAIALEEEKSAGKDLESIVKKEAVIIKQDTKQNEKLAEKDVNIGKEVSGGYKIIEKIAYGGPGILYRAIDPVTKQEVILKTADESRDPEKPREEHNKNTIGEALINQTLNHPNIARVRNVFFDDEKRAYLIIDAIKGSKRLDVTKEISEEKLVSRLKKLGDALAHAHARGISHGDIKPDNTLIAEGEPYVIDFGIAKVDEKINAELANSLTGTHFVDDKLMGTIRWLAPEVLEGWVKPDPQADVFSLGKMGYRMAFSREDAIPIGNVAKNLVEGAKISESLAACIAKATADKEHRYKTMNEFVKDLEGLLGTQTPKQKENLTPSVAVQIKQTPESQERIYYNTLCSEVMLNKKDISAPDFVTLAGTYLAFLNRILIAFESKLVAQEISHIGLRKESAYGTETNTTTSLLDMCRDNAQGFIVTGHPRITIRFAASNEKLNGKIELMYYENLDLGLELNKVQAHIYPGKTTLADKGLFATLAYWSQEFSKRSVKNGKSLQKAALFDLDFALNILSDPEKYFLKEQDVLFDKGKPLYDIHDQLLGYAYVVWNGGITFKKSGFWHKEYAAHVKENLIYLYDRYLLKPELEQTSQGIRAPSSGKREYT